VSDGRLQDLRRRLANSRKRAAYWSGRPSFTAKSFKPGRGGRALIGPDEEYEMAMCNTESLAGLIEQITGKRPAATDYREEFRNAFSKNNYGITQEPRP
jgi:hypothetical protein